jgi:hypothetical protein
LVREFKKNKKQNQIFSGRIRDLTRFTFTMFHIFSKRIRDCKKKKKTKEKRPRFIVLIKLVVVHTHSILTVSFFVSHVDFCGFLFMKNISNNPRTIYLWCVLNTGLSHAPRSASKSDRGERRDFRSSGNVEESSESMGISTQIRHIENRLYWNALTRNEEGPCIFLYI